MKIRLFKGGKPALRQQSGYVMGAMLALLVGVGLTTTAMMSTATTSAKVSQSITARAVTNTALMNISSSLARSGSVTNGGILNPQYAVTDDDGNTPPGGGGYINPSIGSQYTGTGTKIIQCSFFNGVGSPPAPEGNEVAPIVLSGNQKNNRAEIPRAPAFVLIAPKGNQDLTCDEVTTTESNEYGTYTRVKTDQELAEIAGDDKFLVADVTKVMIDNGQGAANLVGGNICDWQTQKLIFENTGPGGTTEFHCVPEQDPVVSGRTLGSAGNDTPPTNTAQVFKESFKEAHRNDASDPNPPVSELRFRSIVAGNNITVSQVGDNIVINSTASGGQGTITGASNDGGGLGRIFAGVNGSLLSFRTITPGNGIIVETIGNNVVISNSGSTASLEGANIGNGTGAATPIQLAELYKNKTIAGNTTFLNFRKIKAAGTVSLHQLADDTIQITGSSVPGPQGPAGPSGSPGPQGPAGPQGPPGSGSWAVVGDNQYNTNAGNIGIGTTTPGQKLTVAGNGHFEGIVRANGFILQSNTSAAHRMDMYPIGLNNIVEAVELGDPYDNNNAANLNNLFVFYNNALGRHARIGVEKVYAYDGIATKHNGVDINYFITHAFQRGFKLYATTANTQEGNFRLMAKSNRIGVLNSANTFAFTTRGDNKFADIRVGAVGVMGSNWNYQMAIMPAPTTGEAIEDSAPSGYGSPAANVNNLFWLWNPSLNRHVRLGVEKIYAYDGIATKHNGIDINYFPTSGDTNQFIRGFRLYSVPNAGSPDGDFRIELKAPRYAAFDQRNTIALKTSDGNYADLRVNNLYVTGNIVGGGGGGGGNLASYEYQTDFNQNDTRRVKNVTGLQPGLWQVTINGVISDRGNEANGFINMTFNNQLPENNPNRKQARMFIYNHPDGTAPYSVTALVRVEANGTMEIKSDNVVPGQQTYSPTIDRITAIRVSN